MGNYMSTIQDVARLAGVSVATISRVLNNSSSVADKTRENVLEVIKKLDYQPNLLGRNLRRMESKMILVLLPSISNPFYSLIVKGIEDVAHKSGYNVMLCNTDSNQTREKIYMELLKNRLADGVIFMAPELNKSELSEIGLKFPVVQCCEYKEGANVPHVSVDNRSAAYKAVKYLISLGHTRVAMISCDNNFLSTIHREQGYRTALVDSNIELEPELIVYGDYSFTSGEMNTTQLLLMKQRPTAIFAISDIMAIGAIKAAKEQGLKVPEDLSIIGFDNIDMAYMCDPMLTTISQPKYEIGCKTMELLMEQIHGGLRVHKNLVLEYELIIRDSAKQNS